MAKLPEQMINEHVRKEIREIIVKTVEETVREMRREGLLKRADDVAYSEISNRLYQYYEDRENDPEMGAALEKIRGDYYAGVLEMYYRQKLALDWIAESYHCELTTISRNKKRLCLRLFQLLQ